MDSQQQGEGWSVPIRWESAFEILSLDSAEPFFPAMGLLISNIEAVRSLARKHIDNLEGLSADTLEVRATLLEQTLRRIADMTDTVTAEHISHWATVMVSISNPGNHFGWPWILRRLAGVRGRDTPSVKPNINNEKLEAIARAIRDQFEDELDLDNKIGQVERLPKSSWDAKIFARNDVGYSPFMTISATITENRFRRVWTEIEKLLSKEEVDELVRWAKSQAPELNLRPEFLERPQL